MSTMSPRRLYGLNGSYETIQWQTAMANQLWTKRGHSVVKCRSLDWRGRSCRSLGRRPQCVVSICRRKSNAFKVARDGGWIFTLDTITTNGEDAGTSKMHRLTKARQGLTNCCHRKPWPSKARKVNAELYFHCGRQKLPASLLVAL